MADKVEGIEADTANVLMGREAGSDMTSAPISNATSTPDAGKTDTAPAPGKLDGSTQGNEPNKGSSKEQTPEKAAVTEDDLKLLLGFAEKPEQKLSRLEREYAASSKEARRLADHNKALVAILKEQGLELVVEDGIPKGLVAGKGYSKEAPDFTLKYKDMSEAEQTMFADEPQAAIDAIVAKAKKALARAIPTVDRVIPNVSPEREAEAISFLSKDEWPGGGSKHADLAANAGMIKQLLAAPNAGKALKEFYGQEPEMALEYLNLKIRAAKQFMEDKVKSMLEAKAKKEKASQETPDFGPSGGGSANVGSESDDIGDRIAKAGRLY